MNNLNNMYSIIVAEDDPGVNRLICKNIERAGHVTLKAFNGLEVIQILDKEKVDLLLLDFKMPGMEGSEVIETLQEKNTLPPFIVMTGYSDIDIAVRMMKLGALDFIIKDEEFHNVYPDKIEKILKQFSIETQLHESQNALKLSEEKSYRILEAMKDAVYICNGNYEIEYANPMFLKYWRKPEKNERCYEIIYKRTSPCANCAKIQSSDTTVKSLIVNEALPGKFFQLSYGPIKYSPNKVSRLNIFRDITEIINAQSQLKTQHNLLNTLINNMPDQIYIKDRDSKFIMNNKSHMQELGVNNQEELILKSDFDFFDEETANRFYQDEKRVLESGNPLINKEEYKVNNKGNSAWTLTTKVPINDGDGNLMGIAGINRDITDRKNGELEILRSRYLLAAKNKIANLFLQTSIKDLFIKIIMAMLDELNSSTGFIAYLDKNGSPVIAAVRGEIASYSSLPGINEKIPKVAWSDPVFSVLFDKKPHLNNEVNIPLTDTVKLKNVLAVPILTSDMSVVGIIVIANKIGNYLAMDLELLEGLCSYIAPIMAARLNEERMKITKEQTYSELLIAKEKAEESDRLKSAFLLNLSHELRTPLNSIMGFSNLLVQKFKNDEKTLGYAELINGSGQDLIKMVEDTIEIARLENTEMTARPVNMDLAKTLNDVYQEYVIFYGTRYPDLDFKLVLSHKSIIINTDKQKLIKTLQKILDNAGKFTEIGTVELSCKLTNNERVNISVKDNGIGISAELNEAVFEKFRKIENKDKIYPGNGLGLSISKALIFLMGGEISLVSDSGKGTCVTLSIPLNQKSNSE